MRISSVKIRRTFDEGQMLAIVSITFDKMFAVHDIKLIRTEDGKQFIAMPSRISAGDEKHLDIVHPITQEAREMITTAVIDAYNKHINP